MRAVPQPPASGPSSLSGARRDRHDYNDRPEQLCPAPILSDRKGTGEAIGGSGERGNPNGASSSSRQGPQGPPASQPQDGLTVISNHAAGSAGNGGPRRATVPPPLGGQSNATSRIQKGRPPRRQEKPDRRSDSRFRRPRRHEQPAQQRAQEVLGRNAARTHQRTPFHSGGNAGPESRSPHRSSVAGRPSDGLATATGNGARPAGNGPARPSGEGGSAPEAAHRHRHADHRSRTLTGRGFGGRDTRTILNPRTRETPPDGFATPRPHVTAAATTSPGPP